MPEPTITYGSIRMGLGLDEIYLLSKTGLEENVPYSSAFFIEKLKGVSGISFRKLSPSEIQIIESIRTEMISRAEITDCITLSGLKPNERTIETVANGK